MQSNQRRLLPAGTKLWTPDGYRSIEEILEGQYVFSRNEFDPDGPIVAKRVEAKYERTGCIFNLHLENGRIIRTTPEHPFFEYDKGWTAAGALKVGDKIRTDAGWITVDELFDTGEYEKVYNLRVAEWHTYFVGDEGWSEAVWAHNTACIGSYGVLVATTGYEKHHIGQDAAIDQG